MDSTTKKIGSSTSSSDDEENLEDTTAREVSISVYLRHPIAQHH